MHQVDIQRCDLVTFSRNNRTYGTGGSHLNRHCRCPCDGCPSGSGGHGDARGGF